MYTNLMQIFYLNLMLSIFYPFRKGLRKVFDLLNNINDMPLQFERSIEKRKTIFKHLKYIVLICYTLHFINEVIIYTPKWLAETNNFCIVSCLGTYRKYNLHLVSRLIKIL